MIKQLEDDEIEKVMNIFLILKPLFIKRMI